MKLIQVFKRRSLWTIAIFRMKSVVEIFEAVDKSPERFFGASGLRLSRGYPSTTADPFLFSHCGRLYIFFERKTDFGKGEISAESMGTDGLWTSHGTVLAEDFHLSYPNIFLGSDGKIYMLPETAASGRAWLYAADEFPFRWRKVRALIDQSLRDPSIIFTKDGVLLLGTTREDELRAYRAPSLDGNFSSEGTLITSDKAISRSGGAPFALGDKLHRPAQNCREFYGQNISIMEVENADSSGYSERMVKEDLFPRRPKWMQLGYHHMSVAKFGNDYFLAVDGRRKDKYINTILLAYFKLLGN